ncbi:hypothetical protein ACSS6W_008444 [Trichoderma asperelloides]
MSRIGPGNGFLVAHAGVADIQLLCDCGLVSAGEVYVVGRSLSLGGSARRMAVSLFLMEFLYWKMDRNTFEIVYDLGSIMTAF